MNDFNLTDIPLTPKDRGGTELQIGCLVVRAGTLTEKQFAAIWGGNQRGVEQPKVIFEDADGTVQPSALQRNT